MVLKTHLANSFPSLTILLTLFSITNCTLRIVQPIDSGFPDQKVPYQYANFGKVPYGRTFSYQLVVPKNNLCSTDGLDHLKSSDKGTYFLV